MSGLMLDSVEISDLEDSSKDLVFKCDWEVEGFATTAGKRLIFNPNLFERVASADWAPESRTFDVDLKWNREVIDTLHDPAAGRREGGHRSRAAQPGRRPDRHARASYEHRGKTLVAKRRHRISVFRIPAQYYPGLREWYSRIAAVDEKPVVLELE